MNTAILYFSGTGNTHWVARQLQKQREEAGETVACIPLEQLGKTPLPEVERLYLGFPVYGFSVPNLFRDRILKTVELAGKDVYLFATVGMAPGDALFRFAGDLHRAGASIIGARAVKMPGSDGMGFMKPDSPTLKKMLDRDFDHLPELEDIRRDLEQLPSKTSPLTLSGFKRVLFRWCRKLMVRFEDAAIRRLHAEESCTRCGLCERICPAGNITVTEQGPEFGDRCMLCLRCLHHCPQKAIQISTWTRGKYRYPGPGNEPFHPAALFPRKPDRETN